MAPVKKTDKLRLFLSYYRPYRTLLIADILCAALVAVLALALPLCVRYVTRDVLGRGGADIVPKILRAGGLMLAIIAAQTCFAVFYDAKGHDMGARIERDMRRELFAQYQRLPFSFYDRRKTGELMSRLMDGLTDLSELYHHAPENLCVYGAQFVGSFFILLYMNWKLTLAVLAFLMAMGLYSFVLYGKLRAAYREGHERMADVNSRVEESLAGIRVAQSFAAGAEETSRFAVENDRYYRSVSNIYKRQSLHGTVIEFLFTQGITIAIVVLGGIWAADGAIDVAGLLVFYLYSAYLTAPVPKLAFMVEQYQEGMAGYRRFREIMEIVPEIRDAENARELQVTKGRVAFENVTFRYGDTMEYVLTDISLEVAPGETVAIVGRSGIGKTTLCSLIPRFYDPCGGTVRVDGMDVRSVTLQSLRRQIGVVRQETLLFAGTVLENIRYGLPGATREQAAEAAEKANAHGFIMALPKGYDTDIGQRGVRLSGGQRQRLSIARVFLKNPPILILDEATSALDADSERAVMESLKALMRGRTVFIIAHRLSTVRNAHRILALTDDGALREERYERLAALEEEQYGA